MAEVDERTKDDLVDAVMDLRSWYKIGTDEHAEARQELMQLDPDILEREISYMRLQGQPARGSYG